MRVLIVDDAPANLELLDQLLQMEGFETLTAEDGAGARKLADSERPDLILLDVVLPDESGFETCAKLKSHPETVDIPIIFLSALDDVSSKVNGFKVGGVDYVSKPVHGEEVLARVRVHLRIRESNRALARELQSRMEEFRSAQHAMFVRPQDLPAANFSVCYVPLDAAGGDFYDVVELNAEVYGYFVADVSGHGVSAAFLTSAIKALLQQYSGPLYSPEDTMRGIDRVMRGLLGEEQYLTACYAQWNRRTGKLSVVNAGHPPVVVSRAGGEVEVVQIDSEPIGIFSSLALQRKDLWLEPGDRFFLYTDGLIELDPAGGRNKGIADLCRCCVETSGLPNSMVTCEMVSRLRAGAGGNVKDDLLLLAVEVEV